MPFVLRSRPPPSCRCLAAASLGTAAVVTALAWQNGDLVAETWRLLAILTVFWSTGLAVCWCALREATTITVVTAPGRLRLSQTSLLGVVRTDVEVEGLQRIAVVTDQDDEDVPYYRGVLTAENCSPTAISEGYCRRRVEHDIRRLEQALRA